MARRKKGAPERVEAAPVAVDPDMPVVVPEGPVADLEARRATERVHGDPALLSTLPDSIPEWLQLR